MKTKLIILLLIITSNIQANAQKDDYIPLAVENAQWLILKDFIATPYLDEYYGYKIQGDTLINDTLYKKVYKREFESINQNYSPPYEITNEYYFGAVRDNVEERKVYGRGVWYPAKDYLMFNYNIQIGDTNTGDMCKLIGDYTVNDIFYGTFQGYDTRIFELETSMCYIYLFEGIGTMNGLFESVNCFEQERFLERYCQDMTDQECLNGFILSNDEIEIKEYIELHPNPVTDILYISNNKNINITGTTLTDLTGREHLIIYGNEIPSFIDLSRFGNGIYFISFYNDNQLIYTQKIIKN